MLVAVAGRAQGAVAGGSRPARPPRRRRLRRRSATAGDAVINFVNSLDLERCLARCGERFAGSVQPNLRSDECPSCNRSTTRSRSASAAEFPRRALTRRLTRTAGALDWLRARHADGGLPLLRLPERRDDLDAGDGGCRKVPRRGDRHRVLRHRRIEPWRADPGATVGPCRAGPWPAARRAAAAFSRQSRSADICRGAGAPAAVDTRFIAISKSGGTAETLMQTSAALAAVDEAGLARDIPALFLGLSEPDDRRASATACARCCNAHGVALLDHDPKVGGRFSVLTNVGLLAARDCRARHWRRARRRGGGAGAGAVRQKRRGEVPAAVGAALAFAGAQSGKTISVMMAYADRLERFTRWYVQLWAESLGKDGKGTTPIAALGPVDQHSQQQLFIAGPRDKLVTVDHGRNRGAGAAHRRQVRGACRRAGFRRQDRSAISSPRRAAPWSRPLHATALPGAHPASRDARRNEPRRTADAFHAGDDHHGASCSASIRSISRRSRRPRCWRRSI